MPFRRHMEVGRIVLINYGPDNGKLATVIDIVDQNKCLIDGPAVLTGVERQVIPFSRIYMTDLVIKDLVRNARQKTLVSKWESGDIMTKWKNSVWSKKLEAKKKRTTLTDFDRFKVMIAKKQKNDIIANKMKQLAA